jgi:hypothetical protein
MYSVRIIFYNLRMEINYSQLLAGDENSVNDMSLEILRQLDDITLSNFCKTNKYYKALCEDVIWLERIRTVPGLSLLLPYRSHYKDLGDFYLNMLLCIGQTIPPISE